MMDENNEQFVAYFLPSKETLAKRHQDEQNGLSYQEDETCVTLCCGIFHIAVTAMSTRWPENITGMSRIKPVKDMRCAVVS